MQSCILLAQSLQLAKVFARQVLTLLHFLGILDIMSHAVPDHVKQQEQG